ncbi:CBS domain-containing protein [Aquibacillus koreensis]|uniref:CBS domain-containing protein n=1 Tax=Aquibacillus koreensis TaxID=279446 RepID=A0A9X3WFH0_9BACI|nr:CBS domain-containing protein [Aquibacillus koreensis]MCT2537411.1 CBS domain-containing protein [Aquibacillus koreensis]MDC3418857.1 CBS domain-containing protein [Aquibacillus koreensis]
MFVRSTMKPGYQCHVASPTDTLKAILSKMDTEDIQAMPVVENSYFKGMISKQKVFQAYFYNQKEQDEFLLNTKVEEIISNENLFIGEDEVFEKTFTSFVDYPILAVVDDRRKFLGIVARTDVLEQFESAFGMKKKGLRIAFTSEESSGRFSRLADILGHFHANIISIATFDETDKLARRIVLKIDQGVNVDKLKRKLEKSGFRVLDIKEV